MAKLTGADRGVPSIAGGGDAASGLRLRTGKTTRAGRRATLRWSAPAADSVTIWRVSLDGRVVARVEAAARLRMQRKIARAGKHRWRVVGFDTAGTKVMVGVRAFRVAGRL